MSGEQSYTSGAGTSPSMMSGSARRSQGACRAWYGTLTQVASFQADTPGDRRPPPHPPSEIQDLPGQFATVCIYSIFIVH